MNSTRCKYKNTTSPPKKRRYSEAELNPVGRGYKIDRLHRCKWIRPQPQNECPVYDTNLKLIALNYKPWSFEE